MILDIVVSILNPIIGQPVIGNLFDFPPEFSYHKFLEWSRQYGKIFQLKILGATHIVISDPDIANDLLALRGATYSERPRIVMLYELVSGSGNLGATPPNRYWRNVRKLAGHTLTSGTLQYYDAFQTDEAARLILDLIKDVGNYEYLYVSFEEHSWVSLL